ncbi:MAG: glycosyltransferase [Propionivibrio sp.]
MPHHRIKVLQLIFECHDRSHDPEELAEQIVAAFPRNEFEVTSAYLRGEPVNGQPQSLAEHVRYFRFPEAALKGLRLSVKRTLLDYCAQEKFDVVICHRYKPVSLMMALNKKLHIPACIGVSHGFGEYKTLWRKLHARLSIDNRWHFVGVSSAVREHLIQQACGFTAENTTAIFNALDIETLEKMFLERKDARQALELPAAARIVGTIGRLVPVKGHIHLIRAFAQIAPAHPDAHLAIIGDGREAESLKAEIARHDLAQRIHLLGWRTRAKQYIRAFDILAIPSLSEGFSLALLEGMSGRRPIIGSDIPAMAPTIRAAGGLCVPPSDTDALAKALSCYLAKPPEALTELGEQAYQYVRANHGIADYRAAYLRLTRQVLARGKQASSHRT